MQFAAECFLYACRLLDRVVYRYNPATKTPYGLLRTGFAVIAASAAAAVAVALYPAVVYKLASRHDRCVRIVFALLRDVTVIVGDAGHVVGGDAGVAVGLFQTAYQKTI